MGSGGLQGPKSTTHGSETFEGCRQVHRNRKYPSIAEILGLQSQTGNRNEEVELNVEFQ